MIKFSFKSAILIVMLSTFIGCQKKAADESLSPGEAHLRTYCRSCHVQPKPSMKSDAEWPEIVRRYGEKAKITTEQQDQIIAYMIANN